MDSKDEGKGQGLEKDGNTEEVLAQEKADGVRPTYKSFKYGFPTAHDVCLSSDSQRRDSLPAHYGFEKEHPPNNS